MMKHGLSFIVFFTLFINLNVRAQNEETKNKITLVEKSLVGAVQAQGSTGWTIEERMAYYKVPGLSIAVIHNYKIEWTKGYGWADEELKIPVSTKTLFQAGSVSKSLNALGVLKLAHDKRIDLYADINQYLTTWKFPYDTLSGNKKISIANILSHTAGLNVSGFSGYSRNSKLPSIVQILDGKSPANSVAVHSFISPGIRYEYSGGGTTISQLIVMNITHLPYDVFMFKNVLKPLGMRNSSFIQPPLNSKLLATGYDENKKEYPGKYHIYPEQAAAGLWTTSSDLAKYIIAVQIAYSGTPNAILTTDMAKTMLKPYVDKQAALGVFIDDFGGNKYFEHDGLTYGFNSQYYGSLKGGNGVVVLINSVNDGLIAEIVNSVAKVYHFKGLYRSKLDKIVKVNDSVLQSYIGQYTLSPDAILTVSKNGGQLYIQLSGQDKIPIFAETPNKFYLKIIDAQLEFATDINGRIIKLTLFQKGNATEALRIK